MAQRNESGVITADAKVTPEKTETGPGGKWRTSGKVIIQIKRGSSDYGALAFPYTQADDEADAWRQVVGLLEAALASLAKVLADAKPR